MSLKVKAISGLRWSALSIVIVNVLQILQLSILTKLLNPSDFGLMAIVMVVMGFVAAFIDMGISNAIIHKQDITLEELSSLYWLNVFAGFMMFIIVSLIAPFISFFYHEESLTHLIVLMATTFVIQSFAQQYNVLWQKELRFKEIAKIEIISKLLTLIVTTGFAYFGYGVFSLVYGAIISSIVQTCQYLIIGLKEYKPYFRFKLTDVKKFLSFGLYQMGERTVNYFNYQMDTILIGKLLGMETLGIYNIAKQLVMRPAQIVNPTITRVTFPAMAKIQNDIPKLKEIYLKTINYISSINFPIYAFIFVFAKEIVLILFGEKWLGAVPIIQILSVWAAWRSTGNPIGSLLLARGRADVGFYWNFGLFFFIPIGILIASSWGLVGIAIGHNVIMAILVYPAWKFLVNKLCYAGFWEYHIQILKPAIVTTFAGLMVYYGTMFINDVYLKILVGLLEESIFIIVLYYFNNRNFIFDLKEFILRRN